MLCYSFSSTKIYRSFTKYFKNTHEWIDVNGNIGTVGISEYAQHQMGEVSFADFEINKTVKAGEELGNIESIKSTSPVFAPMSGTISEINPLLSDDPTIVNKSPEKDGWLCKMKLSDSSEVGKLMNEANYKKYLQSK